MASHVDEYGSHFVATIVEQTGPRSARAFDLRAATVSFLFHKPSGEIVEKSGTIVSAKRGIVEYVGELGFLDECGVWRWQPKIVTTTGLFYGTIADFTLYDHLTPT